MAKFEYLHTRIIASEDVDEEGEVANLNAYVQGELNRLGQQGWELVNMTPHWVWTYDSIQVTHPQPPVPYIAPASEYDVKTPYSVPDFISGWYCTFKRPLG